MKSTFVKFRKINSVASNLEYIADRKEHPETCITYSTCSLELWNEYAAVNQKAFRKSGQKGRCVEAHEAILVCPVEFYRLTEKERTFYTKEMGIFLSKKYGVEVAIALHAADKDYKNMHFHVMYMERQKIQVEEKIATRRMYFDPEGKQVRTKKEATDEKGNLKKGYTTVAKGETYGKKEWTAKNKNLRSNQFTHAMKIFWTNEINRHQREKWAADMEERIVYDHDTSPYLPLQDEYRPLKYKDKDKYQESKKKAQELNMDIRECNLLRREYNEQVDEAIAAGADLKILIRKRKEVSQDILQAIKIGRQNQIKDIIKSGIRWLEQLIGKLLRPEKEKEEQQKAEKPEKKKTLDSMIGSGFQRSKHKKQQSNQKSAPDRGSR